MAGISAAEAHPYASHVVVSGTTVSFILNEVPDSVSITLTNVGLGQGTTIAGTTTRGANSFSLIQGGTTYTNYAITVNKAGSGSPTQISVDGVNVSFEGPRGVAVNQNPQRSYFGTAYNINASPGNGGLRTVGKGVYAVNADQSDAFGYGATAMPTVGAGAGQIQWGSSTTYGGFKVSVGPDDMVYASDASGAATSGTTVGGGTWMITPNLSSATDLFPYAGTVGAAVTTCTASRAIAYGSVASNNLVIYQSEWNRSPYQTVWQYQFGSGVGTIPWTAAPSASPVNEGISSVNEVVCDLDIAKFSKFYYCNEERGTATAGNVSLTIFDNDAGTASGTPDGYLWDSSSAAGGTDPFVGTYSVAVSPDEKYVALIHGSDGAILLAPLTFSQNGATNLPDVTKITTITTGMSGTTRGIAWDAADNIYVNSGGDDLMRVFSLGLTTSAITSGDSTGTNGTFSMSTPAASVSIVADTNSAYKNQLLSTGSGNNGPSTGDFLITRTGPTTAPLTVTVSIGGTAVAGTDYSLTPATTTTVIIPAGSSQTNIVVTPIHTGVAKPTTTVIMNIVGGTFYGTVAPNNTATVTISDDATPTMTIAPTSFGSMYEPNQYDYVTYLVTRLGNTNTNAFTVNIAYSGTAAAGDYNGATSVTVNPGDASEILTNFAGGKLTHSGSNSVVATVTAGTGYAIGTPVAATDWILYDEVPQGTVLFSDTFDTSSTNGGSSTSSNYNVLFATPDNTPNYVVTIPFDYSTLGIPVAPHTTNGTTLGAQISADALTSDLAMGVNIYPVLSSFPGVSVSAFSNSYSMRVDMFLVENTSSQTTEYALFGINHSGTATNWFDNSSATAPGNAWVYDGLWYDVEADGAALGDYVLQTAPVASAGVNNNATAYGSLGASTLTNIFKANPWTVGANFGGAPANQLPASGSFTGGTPSWATVEVDQIISKTATNVIMKINDITIISYTNNKPATEVFTKGNVMLGYDDAYNGNVVPFQGQVIFDNLSVTALVLKITNIQVLGGNVIITFNWSLDEPATAFTLQETAGAVATGAFSDVASTIARIGVGTYTATIPVSGSKQFYQVRHN